MRWLVLGIVLGLLEPRPAAAVYPTDMDFCFGAGLEACMDVAASSWIDLPPFGCTGKVWESFYGRVAWNPLRYVGPITIEVEARRAGNTRFPIYIEYVPLKNHPPDSNFCDGPGRVIMTVWGGTTCDFKETSSPLLLALEIGDAYFIRAYWFDTPRYRPTYMRCIRVTANAQEPSTALEPSTWGLVKLLYR